MPDPISTLCAPVRRVSRTCNKCGASHTRQHNWCAKCHQAWFKEWIKKPGNRARFNTQVREYERRVRAAERVFRMKNEPAFRHWHRLGSDPVYAAAHREKVRLAKNAWTARAWATRPDLRARHRATALASYYRRKAEGKTR